MHINNNSKFVIESYKPEQPYTARLNRILEEYPDGTQVLREILQNSDDAGSTRQDFILDYNTYGVERLYDKALSRYQGPALLALNDSLFRDEDFHSLIRLEDSVKKQEYNKIGAMGLGFNSVYHLTDAPFLISGENFIFFDPHERGYFSEKYRGYKINYVNSDFQSNHPDHFVPFPRSSDGGYEGTIFRYPLRTEDDAKESKISKKIYKPEEIFQMFKKFHDIDNIYCLIFLKSIKQISFYQIKKGSKEKELLYRIELTNNDEIKDQRRRIANDIPEIMKSLPSAVEKKENSVSTESIKLIYKANFKIESFVDDEIKSSSSEWLIINYLGDVKETNDHFYEKFKKYIRDYKFVPNVALAARIDNVTENSGGLFCFLPIPGIIQEFSILVNGYFAVSKNRRNIEAFVNDDLSEDSLPRLRAYWNKYLFTHLIPNAWETLLKESRNYVNKDDIYTIWPTSINANQSSSGSSRSILWKDLLQDVIKLSSPDLEIYRGPSTISELNNNKGYLSLKNGFLVDENYKNFEKISTILESIGFPLFVKMPKSIIEALKNSQHESLIKYITPDFVCKYLLKNLNKWQNYWDYDSKIEILEYVIQTQDVSALHNLPLIPLSDKTFGTFGPSNKPTKFLCLKNEQHLISNKQDVVDNEIKKGIWDRLCEIVKNECNINFTFLDDNTFSDFLKNSITGSSSVNPEIRANDQVELVYKIWNHFVDTNRDLKYYKDLHLLIIRRRNTLYLRKLSAEPKCLKYDHTKNGLRETAEIFKLLGVVFLEDRFLMHNKITRWENITKYIIDINEDKIKVLDILNPNNMQVDFNPKQIDIIVDYINDGLRNEKDISEDLKNTIKHLRIFNELNNNLLNTSIISSSNNNNNTINYLLPDEEEKKPMPIITRSDVKFWNIICPKNIRPILEDILKIPKLEQKTYFFNHVLPYLDKATPISKVDQVISDIFNRWESLVSKQAGMLDKLKEIRIVKISDTGNFEKDFKKPSEIYTKNSSKNFINLFFRNETIYPINNTSVPNYFDKIEVLGAKSTLTVKDLIDRMNLYLDKIKQLDEELHGKPLSLLKYIDKNYAEMCQTEDKSQLFSLMINQSWIPEVKSERNGSQIKSYKKPSECCDKKYESLVFHTKPIVDYEVQNDKLRAILGWNEPPPISLVIEELLITIERYHSDKNKKNFDFYKKKKLDKKVRSIYQHFNDVIDEDSNLEMLKSKLKDKSWVLNSAEFYKTSQLFFDRFNVDGYIVQLSHDNSSNYKKFFKKMGVKDQPDVTYIIYVVNKKIEEIKNARETKSNNNNIHLLKFKYDTEINEIFRLYERLSEIKSSKESSLTKEELLAIEELLIPNMNDGFVKIKDALFNDMANNFIQSDEILNKLVHDGIPKVVTNKLSIKNYSEVIINDADIGLEEFGQHEHVVFQEFLQNADDAKATRFSVIIDKGQYNKDPEKASLLSKGNGLEHWQGPSILIYNDKTFTEEDLVKICELGTGSKWDDLTKIGKFGLGFNSCYNYTDLPSFITGKYVVIFDPHKKYLPKNYPGIKINFIDNSYMIKQFYDQFEPFDNFALNNEDPIFQFKKPFPGTLFRLPLRNSKVKSLISTKMDNISVIKELLLEYRDQMLSELIFLRNIKSMEVYEKLGKTFPPILKWKVDVTNISNENYRTDLGKYSSTFYLSTKLFEDSAKFEVSTNWLICSSGMDEEIEDENLEKYSKEHKLNHSSGIAILLDYESIRSPTTNLVGKIYSNLSLPLKTGLKFNLNSCGWELSSDRNNIQIARQGMHDDKAVWNNFILDKILPVVYIRSIKSLIDNINNNSHKLKHHQIISKYWPITKYYSSFGSNVLKLISEKDHKVFWSELDNGKFVGFSEAYIGDYSIESVVFDYLLDNGIAVVKLQSEEIKSFDDYNIPYKKVNAKLVKDLKETDLYNKFQTDKFQNSTKIKNFDSFTISKVLEADLPRNSCIDYNPSSLEIPNKYWLDEIWRIINYSKDIDPGLSGFPLIEICDEMESDEFKSNKLISLEEARRKNPLSKSYDDKLNKILVKLNIRIATRSLEGYVLEHNNINLIISLRNYECYDRISSLSADEIDYLRSCISANLLNNLSNYNRKLEIQQILTNLPIWRTYSRTPIYQRSSDVYLLPEDIPYFPTNTAVRFVKLKSSDRSTAKIFSIRERSLFEYITKDILPYISRNMTEDLKGKYVNILNSTFQKCDANLINYLKTRSFLPNITFERLYSARDLYDTNNKIFKDLFQYSKKFVHPELQSNPKSLEVLKSLGFIHNLYYEDTFIKCAEEIETLSCTDISSADIKNLVQVSENLLDYLYTNIESGLIPEEDTLFKIKFVPISSNGALNAPYKYHTPELSSESQVFECFNNLALKKNLELCWTQKFFYSEKVVPHGKILKIYQSIEKPSIEIVIEHLKRIANDLSRSEKWEHQKKLLFEVVEKIYAYFESLCGTDEDEDELLKSSFDGQKLILNGTDPYEINNWVEGKHLVKKIRSDIDDEKRAIAEYLLENYPKLLNLVGVIDLEIPQPPPIPSLESASDLINNFKIHETLLNDLDKDSIFNNITFEINNDKISANLYILAISSEFFKDYLKQGKLNSISTCSLTEIDNVQPDILRTIIRVLYGQTLDNAVKCVFPNEDLQTDKLFECLRLSSLLKIKNLKEYLECKLCSILASNLQKFKEFAKQVNGQVEYPILRKYCEEVLKENPNVME
ncbi:6213_t:CDS:2 [Entrophospora sp. SA101]|nr:994_t:CDS:2 [Entrophospora sp. SA101]CAJ0640829.1 6213_t:CDS:2 [Entrophospora sp. SA101]CAJ0906694.1 4137_t:CDS:2 [Entrophospora sp. SA101]